ncbi:T9SS type A sorting domain-containing protein [Psychroserpens jangbogonensis]|uniref:T9SS type A sorting domain-containing protein n=1 Tax=Psychroserpens jangbogonensis TaxID=1484460 RepID=UPI00053D0266|nr:T9SS type A sorting domain-containing protein [Psychroserpens jangbogonensis]
MKTKLLHVLFFFSLFIFNYSFSQTQIPDPIFEQYLIDEGYDTAPIDGSVPTANIVNVTIVDLGFTGVSDLTGIEDFTALTDLYAYNNSISSLDLSSNTALTYLSISSNPLSGLDLSNNIALHTLIASVASLNSLDLSNNIALTQLYVDGNSLNDLNLSNNTVLTYLEASYNTGLTSLDISTNTELIHLSINNTSISSVNVSTNTALTTLFTYNMPLSSLDVSTNSALSYLITSDTPLSSLDLSNNSVLTGFSGTNTPNLDCITVADANAATAGTGIYIYWQKDVDDTYSEDCDALSLLDFDISKVYVGPNPIKDELDIVLNNLAILNNVSLFDITGKLILKSISTNISTSYIESGLYLVKITTDKGSFTKKLVKN